MQSALDAKTIEHMPARTVTVQYDLDVQQVEIREHIHLLFNTFNDPDIPGGKDGAFNRECQHLAFDLCSYKNPAFREELEVRQLHVIGIDPKATKRIDSGGTAFGKKYEKQPIKFYMKKGMPFPYLDITFMSDDAVHPIREVVIGPRNLASERDIILMMGTLGIPNVNVRRSVASYR